ncbi:MAG: hypothetical protein ACOCU4_05795 [Alkalispirochaeta sp.]
MRINYLQRWAFVIILFLVTAGAVSAQTVFRNPDYDYVVDIPAGWQLIDGSQTELVSFSDPESVAVFQIMAFSTDRFVTVDELDEYVRQQFSMDGDRVSFRYLDQPAIFADYEFSTGGFTARGYMTFINGDEHDFAVMTYIPEEYYEEYHDLALSAVDSFSMDVTTRNTRGPVSQFFAEEAEAEAASGRGDAAVLTLPEGGEFELPPAISDEAVQESHQVLIEREARVLSEYAPTEGAFPRPDPDTPQEWVTAWRRYFRMVYRDSFSRLEPVSEAIFQDLAAAGVAREEMPARILEWLQGAEYQRTASLSDLLNPSACLVQFAGDCDSLGITYAIILHHLGFDAILMASVEYSHAMVGVDVPGEGARFPFEGREWLVAELTDEVDIGQIDQTMSDIGGWIGVKLDPTVQW